MKKNILSSISVVFVTLVIVASCKKPIGKCEEFFEKGCETTQDYAPVCGCNDKTYPNKSYAECASVEYVNGSCD